MLNIHITQDIKIGNNFPFVLIAGPCVIESEENAFNIASEIKRICGELEIPFIFKASYDKANRSSINSYRGPGIAKGLQILKNIKKKLNIPLVSDVHLPEEINLAKDTLDMIQIPAFLCRQTDLIIKAAKTGKPINVKKGQFLAPWDIRNIIDKVSSTGNKQLLLTERGTMFGYNNLVVDFKSLPIIRQFGYPVCFDATHSVQLPGGAGTSSGGQKEFISHLVRASVAVGIDALFLEVHNLPESALSDGQNMVSLDELSLILEEAKAIDKMVKKYL